MVRLLKDAGEVVGMDAEVPRQLVDAELFRVLRVQIELDSRREGGRPGRPVQRGKIGGKKDKCSLVLFYMK